MKHSAIASPKANAVGNPCLVTVVLRAGNGLSRLSWATRVKTMKGTKKNAVVFASSYSHPLITVPPPPAPSVGRSWLREGNVGEQGVKKKKAKHVAVVSFDFDISLWADKRIPCPSL